MNYLFCSVGKHGKLIENFKMSLDKDSKIVATSNNKMVPALYLADKQYIVPDVKADNYVQTLLFICKDEKINAITTMLDVETIILAENKELFEAIGVEVLTPSIETAKLCFNKYSMFQYLDRNGINTIKSYKSFRDFTQDYNNSKCTFPIFVKPNTGRGSVGARKILDYKELECVCKQENDLIIQEFIDGIDIDVDVYVDAISHKPVCIFSKRKIEAQIGGTTKAISFKDEKLFTFIEKIVSKFEFSGPIDVELFYKDGNYYVIEINPRFGAAYLHAYGCGIDFIKLINNNLEGIENKVELGNYDEDMIMMMYNSVVIINQKQLASGVEVFK